ncbi:cyclase family protein [Streptomyces sp. DW26H14]|uniref:cyclase family protein n=1 Tax=Streptomyces sp. DW26H14 TaxID=3435395 RepID=UPI00403DD03B
MPPATHYAFKALGRRLSNWGRWGEDDQLGTANLLTDETRRAASRLIRTGRIVDLGMPFGDEGPQTGANGRFNPIHRMTQLPTDGATPSGQIVSDDMVVMPLQCATQWDSLAHVGYDGLLYNGTPASAVTATAGASRNSADQVVGRLIGRGVLLDIARLKGVPSLGASEEITAGDLDSAVRAQGVEVRSGDILLVRTGWYRYFLDPSLGVPYVSDAVPGLGVSCCEWLHERQVAAVAADNQAVEVKPSVERGAGLPVHMVLIRDLGMTLGEMFDLEELSEVCASEGRWDFFFSGLGLKISRSVGSPVSPLAIM